MSSSRLAIILTLQSECAGSVRIRSSVPEHTNVQWYIAQLKARVGRKGMAIISTKVLYTSNYDAASSLAEKQRKVFKGEKERVATC